MGKKGRVTLKELMDEHIILTASKTPTEADDPQGTTNRGGRPNGTTNATKEAHVDLAREALDECTVEVVTMHAFALDKTLKHATGKKYRVPHGAFEKAVKIICKKYNLETSEINMNTILSRTKPGRTLKVKHRGMNSPMVGIEAHFLAAILRCDTLCQPVAYVEGLTLAK
jgi:hypothetical protein